jgi:NAD(P)H-flavin reductase
VSLLVGARSQEDLLYRAELADLAARLPTFRFLPTLTRPDPSWTGLGGRVQDHLDTVIDDPGRVEVYLCGHGDMVKTVRETLERRGVDGDRVHDEHHG